MEPRRDRVQDRILPAVLTALGVTFLAAGLLTWTVPVEAGPPPSVPDNGAVASDAPPSLEPSITLPPLGTAPPESQPPTPEPLVVEPDEDRVATRVGSRRSTSICRSSRATTSTRCATSRCTSAAQPAGQRRRDVPLRPRPARHVRAAPADEGRRAARDDRRGVDERRPQVPLRDHRGAPPPDDRSTGRARSSATSSGCRHRRARAGRWARRRSAPGCCRSNGPPTARRTRRRSRSTASSPPPGRARSSRSGAGSRCGDRPRSP